MFRENEKTMIKLNQTYVRVLREQEASCARISLGQWHPVTMAGIWGCGRIINNCGGPYLVDLHSVKVCSHWAIKTVEVEL